MTKYKADVLIVGAGLSGLMAAHALKQQGLHPVVVEKNAQCGGRLATRAIGPGLADCGAQFFTVRDPAFRWWVNRWIDEGLVFQWSLGWADASLGAIPPDGHPRYAVYGGMRALADHLARDLTVQLSTRLVSLSVSGSGWQGRDEKGTLYTAPLVLLTPPVPLALNILDAGNVTLNPGDRAALERLDYAPSLAGMFWINGDVNLPEPGAVQRPNATITWIADNHSKGISPNARLITVHAGPEYSRQIWTLPDWQVLVALESALHLFKDPDADIIESYLERWRYALPITLHPDRYLLAADLPPLAFAGDAFGGPRIEGAALSGLAVGERWAARVS